MIPTRRLWALIALGIPAAAISTAAGQPYFIVLYNLALLAAAWISWRLAPSARDLTIRRRFDSVLSVRAVNRIELIVENGGAEDIRGRIRDEPPDGELPKPPEFALDIRAGREELFRYELIPEVRGADEFRGVAVRLECPFGLVEKQETIAAVQPVRIYPNVLALREFNLLQQHGRLRELGIRRANQRGLGTEFESLRDYAEGDDFRKIDHKATARRGKLIVRQFEQERNQAVILCIDAGRQMLSEVDGVRKLDIVLDSILMLANAAIMAGDQVGLLVYSDEIRSYLPPKKGRVQVGSIIDTIHDLVAEPVEADAMAAFSYLGSRWKRRALVVDFTDYEDPDRATEIARAFTPIARRNLGLVVRVTDARVQAVFDRQIKVADDMYRKVAAQMLLADRRDASRILHTAGIQTLESEPAELAVNLVNFYLRAKERSLI